MQIKFGRKARTFKNVPHMSALLAGRHLPPAPIAVDNTVNMPSDFGQMLNNDLGCCTCAAVFHAIQVWTFNARKEITYPDANVEALYEAACGYKPDDPSTDQGGIEQDVLSFLVKRGAPVGELDDGSPWKFTDKIVAFLEVDFRNLEDVKRTIADFGVCYIGFDVPQSVMDSADDPSVLWDVGGNEAIVGGHAVILTGYELGANGKWEFTCISWGKRYRMSVAFLGAFLDEAYAIVAKDWLSVKGVTPLGMTQAQLLDTLKQLRVAA